MFTPVDNNVYSGLLISLLGKQPEPGIIPQSVTDSCHKVLGALLTLQQAVIVGVAIEEFTSITFPTLPSNELAGLTVGLGYCM